MKKITKNHAAAFPAYALIAMCLVAPLTLAGPKVEETISAFITHVRSADAFDASARDFIERTWNERDREDDPEEFLLEALAVLSKEFSAGLDAYDDEDYAKAHTIMANLGQHPDPYLSANAKVYAIKSLVEDRRIIDAKTEIESFLEDPTAVDLYTPYAAEMAFVKGYVALQALEYDQAAASLQTFVNQYPDAADRLRVSAKQMLAELARRQPERLGDVADLMVYSGHRLGHDFTGKPVQEKQQQAIDLLDKLIEEAESAEKSGGGGGGSGSGQQSPQTPMQDSTLPGGTGSQGQNLRNARKIKPGEAWGSLPPAERQKILQSLRDSFPSRYRKLVEQYYQDLSKKP